MSRISFVAFNKLINSTLFSRYQQGKAMVLSHDIQKQNLHLMYLSVVKKVEQ